MKANHVFLYCQKGDSTRKITEYLEMYVRHMLVRLHCVSIKSFQSIRFRLRKESTLASFKAVRGTCEERLSKAASICSPLSRVV